MWLRSQRKRKRKRQEEWQRLRRGWNQDEPHAKEKGQEEVTLEITNDTTTKTNHPAINRSPHRSWWVQGTCPVRARRAWEVLLRPSPVYGQPRSHEGRGEHLHAGWTPDATLPPTRIENTQLWWIVQTCKKHSPTKSSLWAAWVLLKTKLQKQCRQACSTVHLLLQTRHVEQCLPARTHPWRVASNSLTSQPTRTTSF